MSADSEILPQIADIIQEPLVEPEPIVKSDPIVEPILAAPRALSPVKASSQNQPPSRVTRASRRQLNLKPQVELNTEIKDTSITPVKCPSPLSGTTDIYDLYRTLASPSDKDFDSQSSILGSISSKETTFAVGVPEDSRVIHSRGSSDPTSDIDTSQSSVIAAPPSEINVSPDVAFDTDEPDEKEKSPAKIDIPEEQLDIVPESPKLAKRSTRRAMKSPALKVIEAPPAPAKTAGRTTRSNNIINTTVDAPVPVVTQTPTKPVNRNIKSYTRKRKNVEPVEEETAPVPATATASAATPSIVLTSPIPAAVTSPSSQATIISSNFDQNSIPNSNSNSSNNNWSVVTNKLSEIDPNEPVDYKLKSKLKKCWYDQDVHSDSSSQEKDNSHLQQMDIEEAKMTHIESNDNQVMMDMEDNDKQSVKLVIKKASIFRSRNKGK